MFVKGLWLFSKNFFSCSSKADTSCGYYFCVNIENVKKLLFSRPTVIIFVKYVSVTDHTDRRQYTNRQRMHEHIAANLTTLSQKITFQNTAWEIYIPL